MQLFFQCPLLYCASQKLLSIFRKLHVYVYFFYSLQAAMITGDNLGQKANTLFFSCVVNSDVFKFLWLFTLIS